MTPHQFEKIILVLKVLPREDFYDRQFIAICLRRFRGDASYTGRQIFRHAVRAFKQWPWENREVEVYSDDYYKAQLVLPPHLVRAVGEALSDPRPAKRWTRASWARLNRSISDEIRKRERIVRQLRRAGIGGSPFLRRWKWRPSLGQYVPEAERKPFALLFCSREGQ